MTTANYYNMPLGSDSDCSELLTICECIGGFVTISRVAAGKVSRMRINILDRGQNSRIGARFML